LSGRFNTATGKLTVTDSTTAVTVEAYELTVEQTGGKGPLPSGYYYVLDIAPGSGDWRLEPADFPFGDGIHNQSGRDAFWLHAEGSRSLGCITCVEGGGALKSLLETTSSAGTVDVQVKRPWYLGGGYKTMSVNVLGIIRVVNTQIFPYKKP
jgi:hypothetical protein